MAESVDPADKELRQNLSQFGFTAGPITSTTRDVLARKLRRLSITKTDEPSNEKTGVSKVKVSNGQQQLQRSPVSSNKDIFLSYSRDVERRHFVLKIKKDLESKGYSVFVDIEDIKSGSDWHSVIGAALDNCQALVAVLTQKYISSQYCRKELFMTSSLKKPIFPVMLEEVDFSGNDGSGVRLAISSLNWVSFKDTNYKEAFSKLLEGLKHQGVEPSSTKHH